MEYIAVLVGAAPSVESLTRASRMAEGECEAAAVAQCYAAIVYHRLQTLPDDYRLALREELGATQYGALLLSMASGTPPSLTERANSAAAGILAKLARFFTGRPGTEKCTPEELEKNNLPEFFFFVAERVPPLKKLLQMDFEDVSTFHDKQEIIDSTTTFTTHFGFTFLAPDIAKSWRVLGTPSTWKNIAGTELLMVIKSINPRIYKQIRHIRYMSIPSYITIQSELPSIWEAPITFVVTENNAEYSYQLRCAIISKQDRQEGTLWGWQTKHTTSLCLYDDNYYEIDGEHANKIEPVAYNMISAKPPDTTGTEKYGNSCFSVLIYSLEIARHPPPIVSLQQLKNATGVCAANATAQCYAAIVYHRLWRISDKEQAVLREELEKTRYGRLLLAMLSGEATELFDSDATWQCTDGKNDSGRAEEYFFFAVEGVPVLKRLLQMHFVQTSSMSEDAENIKSDTSFSTHLGFGLDLSWTSKKNINATFFFSNVIGLPSGWNTPSGWRTLKADVGVITTIQDSHLWRSYYEMTSLQNLQYKNIPNYITANFMSTKSGYVTILPLSFVLTDTKGIEYKYTLLSAILVKYFEFAHDTSMLEGMSKEVLEYHDYVTKEMQHSTAICCYQNLYYEFDDHRVTELKLTSNNEISTLSDIKSYQKQVMEANPGLTGIEEFYNGVTRFSACVYCLTS